MKKEPLDRWLQGATFAVALVRVLRGDDPKEVLADVEHMSPRAAALRESIETYMRAPSSRAPSSAGSSSTEEPGSSPAGGDRA